ncbi:MAG: hypothetical protein NTY53_17200, partial [Kiritimatiellaeota bacterium]|nr:hypothetical protein [Kiritimatiellota bacterium]
RELLLKSGLTQPSNDQERAALKTLKDLDYETRTGNVINPDGTVSTFEGAQRRAALADLQRRDQMSFFARRWEDVTNKPRPTYEDKLTLTSVLPFDVRYLELNPAKWDWQ